MSETLVERIKRWNTEKPNDIMQAFSSDLYEIAQRAEAAEARAAALEAERDEWQRKAEHLEAVIISLHDEADANEAALVQAAKTIDDLRSDLGQARRDLAEYRAEIERLIRKEMTT